MAGMYKTFIKLALDGDIDLLVDDVKAVLIDDADYIPNYDTHDFYDDVAAGAKVGTPVSVRGDWPGRGRPCGLCRGLRTVRPRAVAAVHPGARRTAQQADQDSQPVGALAWRLTSTRALQLPRRSLEAAQ